MKEIIKVTATIDSGFIGEFRHISSKIEQEFKEFIDNSFQSFKDNEIELKNHSSNPDDVRCIVKITWDEKTIVVRDNAYGMNLPEFRRALRSGEINRNAGPKSRNRYGVGLKHAAVFFGDLYSIKSTQLDSEDVFYSKIDVEYFEKNNPENFDVEKTQTLKSDHFTEIKIEKLRNKFTIKLQNDLIEKLGVIFKNDIKTKELEIFVNGIEVKTKEPELRVNEDTGSQYFAAFDNEFYFNGKKYSYTGWAGILKVGNTKGQGFSLSHLGRVIQMHYVPDSIFGGGNTFARQRIVGDIELTGDNWDVSFNKNMFIMDSDLDDAFAASIKKISDIKMFLASANKIRVRENALTPKKVDEALSKSKVSFGDDGPVNNYTADAEYLEKSKKDKEQEKFEKKNEDQSIEKRFIINDVLYKFVFEIINDEHDDWLKIVSDAEEENKYIIKINTDGSFFQSYKNNICNQLLIDLSMVFAIAQIQAENNGLKRSDSEIYISTFNNIIKGIK